MTVEIGLTPDGRWDTDLPGLVRASSEAGFSALGASADAVDASTAPMFESAGLRCHEVLALVVDDDDVATLAAAASLAEAASTADAEWVLTVFRSGLTSAMAKVVERCAAMFCEAGSRMAVEFSPMGPVFDIHSGLEVVEAAGVENAGLLIDTWHFSFGDSTFEDLAQISLEQIAYVQFCDALAPISESLGRETMRRRALPGDGILELERFASTLLDRGWDGLVSVEVLSDDLRTLPMGEIARRAYDSTIRYWN